ncbi:MAG: hypothetical protein U0359_38530 [Byssovorax sp.]
MTEQDEKKAGWLEVVHDDTTREKIAFCPYRDQMVEAHTCYSCKDCSGLVLSPDAKHYYVFCERAQKDGVWVEGGGDGRPVQIHGTPAPIIEIDPREVVDPVS